jgi:polar amino acid transport system permease protein
MGNWIIEELKTLGDILVFLAPAVPMTIQLTLTAFTFALILGLFVGLARTSRNKMFSIPSRVYVDVIRGIPLLVQIFFIYFGLGKLLNLNQFVAGVAAVSICFSAYIGEIIRAGIQAIHKGQFEAAYSLGMTPVQTMRHVILPQTFPIVLPPIANEFIASLKDSSLVSVIGLRELTRAGREYYSQFFVAFETWLVVGILYLAMTFIFTKITAQIERRFRVHGWGMG